MGRATTGPQGMPAPRELEKHKTGRAWEARKGQARKDQRREAKAEEETRRRWKVMMRRGHVCLRWNKFQQ